MPQPHMFIATHHKAGTVWMVSTFRRIAQANGNLFVHLNTGESGWAICEDKLEYFEQQRATGEAETDRPIVFVDYHSAIPDLTRCKSERGCSGIHIVRDPRDMILSAIRYHLVSDEQWLHEPRKDFGGLTYQEKLCDLGSLEERVRFEIDHWMGWTIRRMNRFDRQGVFRDVKYEKLIVDEDMLVFHELLVGMGMRGADIFRSLQAYWHSSIFGGMKKAAESGTHGHIRNSRPKQWQSQLSLEALDLIQDAFGSEIVGLGYELADGGDLVYNQPTPTEN